MKNKKSKRNKSILIFLMIIFALIAVMISCSDDVSSKPKFIFKEAPKSGVIAKIGKKEILASQFYSGIENDIYEAEMKVFEIKMGRMEALILEEFMKMDPRKKGMTNDQFLEKYITKEEGPKAADIEKFIKERKIPKEHINAQMKERIKQFLSIRVKRDAIDKWMKEKTKKNIVEVYLKKPKRPVFEVNIDGSPFTGGADAKVTIVEFTEFQCPFCAKGAMTMKKLLEKYGSKIKLVFKHYVLPRHTKAKIAAEAALCAAEQKKEYFWKMNYEIFGDQTKLGKDNVRKMALKIGVKSEQFDQCMKSHKYVSKIDSDMEDGKKVGIGSTPTFFVNGQMVLGAVPIEEFIEIIEEELAK